MRIVVDTNIAVSGLLWAGPPRHLVDLARDRVFMLCTSIMLLVELAEVIARPRFAERILRAGVSAADLVRDYSRISEIFEPAALATPVSRDPDDDIVLSTALAAQADLIASGDRDLLDLGAFHDIPIVTAVQALGEIAR